MRVFRKAERLPWQRPDVQRMTDRRKKEKIFDDVDKWLRDTWAVFNGTRTTR